MDEERLIEIETRLAFQEQTIKTLSDIIYKQQQKLDELGHLYTSLEKEPKTGGKSPQGINDLIHEKPPHY
jgi:SlyX protein